ncbi:hypothetical protein [Arcticibacterium luteifluviistationis]|uniref:Uncharacterized protein n=1 Tax=Arcticibacterium luteifluviistationis TaxID=1784714 RepID=A0A2Z4GCF4_9BACT|nr:hypothetical protein [Arcticibacterium luteifluviistationis]AWV98715.1 hypothetical protein DJ013_11235 [Arcticibacterium luteifluviistationis]
MFKKLGKNIALLTFLFAFLGGQVYVLRMVSEVNITTFLQINEEHDNEDDSRDELDSKKLAKVGLADDLFYFLGKRSLYTIDSPSDYDGDFSAIVGPPPDHA